MRPAHDLPLSGLRMATGAKEAMLCIGCAAPAAVRSCLDDLPFVFRHPMSLTAVSGTTFSRLLRKEAGTSASITSRNGEKIWRTHNVPLLGGVGRAALCHSW